MFEQQKFSSILEYIISQYESLRDFSNVCGFNRTSISKYVRKELPNPPSPDILKKIADNSKGLTTYMELMLICGYVTRDNIEETDEILKRYNEARNNKIEMSNMLKNIHLNKKEQEIADEYIKNINSELDAIPDDLRIGRKDINISIVSKYIQRLSKIKDIDIDNTIIYILGNINIKVGNTISLLQDAYLKKRNSNAHNPEIGVINIPVLGRISAGLPLYADQQLEGYMFAPESIVKKGNEYFYLRVQRR